MKELSNAEFKKIVEDRDTVLIVPKQKLSNFMSKTGSIPGKNGYLVNSETSEEETFEDLEKVKSKQVGGVFAGSKIFIRKNVADLSEYLVSKTK